MERRNEINITGSDDVRMESTLNLLGAADGLTKLAVEQ
jgi:hypothetical protein